MKSFAIGVDLGGTNLRIAAVDDQGTIGERVAISTNIALGRDHVLDDMCRGVEQVLAKSGNSANLLGIGIGVPGIIDSQTGLLRESPNLPGWANYPVRAEIERRLKTVVILENDARAAALGEKWLGAAKAFDDMAMLTLGTGVGGGLVMGGAVWHGMNGMAGELGHTTVVPDGHPCGCGNHGCLEQYASATAMVRMAREAIAENPDGALSRAAQADPNFNSKTVYDLAMHNDPDAKKVFDRVGRALGIVLASLINSLNLPIYVVGGGASSAWDAFSPAIFEEMRKRSMVYAATAPPDPNAKKEWASAHVIPSPGRNTIVMRAMLGTDAGLIGAARLPMIPESKR
jgi:glucokinase